MPKINEKLEPKCRQISQNGTKLPKIPTLVLKIRKKNPWKAGVSRCSHLYVPTTNAKNKCKMGNKMPTNIPIIWELKKPKIPAIMI